MVAIAPITHKHEGITIVHNALIYEKIDKRRAKRYAGKIIFGFSVYPCKPLENGAFASLLEKLPKVGKADTNWGIDRFFRDEDGKPVDDALFVTVAYERDFSSPSFTPINDAGMLNVLNNIIGSDGDILTKIFTAIKLCITEKLEANAQRNRATLADYVARQLAAEAARRARVSTSYEARLKDLMDELHKAEETHLAAVIEENRKEGFIDQDEQPIDRRIVEASIKHAPEVLIARRASWPFDNSDSKAYTSLDEVK